MDRQIIYPGQIPLETDLLNTNRNAMVGLGLLAADLFGTSTIATGLGCSQLGTPALSVQVAPGRLYSLQNVDGSAYSSLAADTTHQIMKQGIVPDIVILACAAPVTGGFSVNYLIEAAYQDTDTTAVALPYYNASNPTQAYTGPANSGAAQNTQRKSAVVLQAKAGVAAATGTQVTPAPDSGNVGLWVVTVANGQATILNANIVQYSAAPFVAPLPTSFRTALLVAGNGPWANPATADPQHLFEIVNDNSAYQVMGVSSYGAASFGNNLHWNRYYGTLAAPSVIGSGAYTMSMGFRGWDGVGGVLSQSMAAFQHVTTEAWGAAAHGNKFVLAVTPNGGSSRVTGIEVFATPGGGSGINIGDATTAAAKVVNATTVGVTQVHGSSDLAGAFTQWWGSAHATLAGQCWQRGNLQRFQSTAGTDYMVLDASGNMLVGVASGANHFIQKTVTSDAGNIVLTLGGGSAGSAFYGVSGSGANAANAALRMTKDGTTSRSINAGGTINASGLDYAEYMRKAAGTGALVKGQLVGIDTAGHLTDKWADAISFVIKSTSPSYVGGDGWGSEESIGATRPEEPQFAVPDYTGDPHAGTEPHAPEDLDFEQFGGAPRPLPEGASAVDVSVHASLMDAYADRLSAYREDRARRIGAYKAELAAQRTATAAYMVGRAKYVEQVAALQAEFDAITHPAWDKQLAEYLAVHEAARQTVDRIAFAGQVPANVLGASPGDYIVPEQDGAGIKGTGVKAPTFEQYRLAVGKVIAIEADGRARVIVKVA